MRSFIGKPQAVRSRGRTRRTAGAGLARGLRRAGALGAVLALGACAVAPPTGPTVMALPGKGKSLAAFQQEDLGCRQYAEREIGYTNPGQAANAAGVGSAVIGTALGAAAGAAIGSVSGAAGAGAAIGGATGLVGGSMIGLGNAQASAGALQERYNISYTQCMYAQGNTVVSRPPGYGYGYGYPGPPYGYPPAVYSYPPGYYPGYGGWYR